MLNLKKVAVTGGLSCGKSTVCRFLKELGAYVVSSDDIVHHLLSSGTSFGQEVIKLLGMDILINQEIDRARVAQKVFQNDRLLKALENILHPAVYDEINNEFQKQMLKTPQPPLFIAEVPLLFESHGETHFDKIAVVISDSQLCQERFARNKRFQPEEYLVRSKKQLPLSEKMERADFVVFNNGTLDELLLQTRELFKKLTD